MKIIMVMYDSLNRLWLQPYGSQETATPNFNRLAEKSVTFNRCYVGSMPCMPARRELHTGRDNFLHRSWGPLEPFDDSMSELLSQNGIYTHLATDHYHYFEDGGATYHTRYNSWEGFRGQEGDGFMPLVRPDDLPATRNYFADTAGRWVEQDLINRRFMKTPEDQPQNKTFAAGLNFLRHNHSKDQWFLQIETFDPHEPFFTIPDSDKENGQYTGPLYDWPPYRSLNEEDSTGDIKHIRAGYRALLGMCDDNLGRILDFMDAHDMWEDTMLIVCTDHGFLLSEHNQWAKCHCPFYEEVSHTPLFIWDPRSRQQGKRADSLVQTIDLPATILDFFHIPLPSDMQGYPLRQVIEQDEPVRHGALFGLHGGQVNCTDGRYVYMRSPVPGNTPLYQYTLMPTRHGGRRAFFSGEELESLTLSDPLSFTKGLRVMRTTPLPKKEGQHQYPTALYDLQNNPGQLAPISDPATEADMIRLMSELMARHGAPAEQWERLGIPYEKSE